MESPRLITSGRFRRHRSSSRSTDDSDWVYFIASPDNPTQRYLFASTPMARAKNGSRPRTRPGTHDYEISPDATVGDPPVFGVRHECPTTTLISLPAHEMIRMLSDNKALKTKVDALKTGRYRVLPGRHRGRNRPGRLVHVPA